ncbi:hypothetical protein [Leptospira sp. GIMC2001]|uniref:hypothetical protein n=1 Tax=Leptospira sp. GIMC2001 TaxID=1513297 RepID=UPI00234B4C3D|nr:hypothetical protein [Leptospira sp. GIMC2001]WCL50774.1 hypothetical protein O4O04_08170 [Leptospira sp. GIMC2001]
MKNLFIYALFVVISCKSYEIVQIDKAKLSSKSINSNIALVGFFPYKYEKNGNVITAFFRL